MEKLYVKDKDKKVSVTKCLLLSFLGVAGITYFCCSLDDNDKDSFEIPKNMDYSYDVITDENGWEYTLQNNDDGTETVIYPNGESETFKRESDGSLTHISGTTGLIAGMAASYYLFHGLSGQNNSVKGHYDNTKSKYVLDEPLQRIDRERQDKRTTTATGGGGGARSNNDTNITKESPKTNSAGKTAVSDGAKGGFGGAGARTAVS